MKQVEPPSAAPSAKQPLFLIGKDSRGRWVVQQQNGMSGGLFVDRVQALRYAMFENGRQPQAVIMVPDVLELDMSRKPPATHQQASNANVPRDRRVA